MKKNRDVPSFPDKTIAGASFTDSSASENGSAAGFLRWSYPLYTSIVGTGMMSITVYWTTGYPHPILVLSLLFVGMFLMVGGRAPDSGPLVARMGSPFFFFWVVFRLLRGIPFIVVLADFTMGILAMQWFLIASPRAARQAMILAGMLVLAAAAMNVNFFLPLAFLPFFILFISTLGHLAVGESRCTTQRQYAGGSVLSAGYGVVLVLLFLGLWTAIFYLLPRREAIGVGSVADQRRLLGFSDRLQLGELGPLADNPQVVMRVKPVLLNPPGDELLSLLSNMTLRGCSFISYHSGSWSRTGYGRLLVNMTRIKGRLEIPTTQEETRDPLLELELFLENTDPPVLFVPEGARQITSDLPFLALETDGSLSFTRRRTGVENYEAKIRVGRRVTAPLDASSPAEIVPLSFLSFVDTGDVSVSVLELAEMLASGTQTWDEKIRAVVSHLGRTCRYGIDPIPEGIRDPVAFFLFQSHQGTCEHFATSMVLLLRAMGVPARPVNGYAMGEWNAFGGFFNVRQRDAHTWVEVYRPGQGWLTYDPTPSERGSSPFSLLERIQLKEWWNRFESLWFTYVYSYDRDKQQDALQALRKRFFGFSGIQGTAFAISLFAGFIAMMLAVIRITPPESREEKGYVHLPWLPDWYKEWAAGFADPRCSWETPREFHARLSKNGLLAKDLRPLLTELEDALDRGDLGGDAAFSEKARSLAARIIADRTHP
ncbi:MAG: transglutaminaseTgpA domain-containing protein [Candidatus Ozemobacteraceae bacterium]